MLSHLPELALGFVFLAGATVGSFLNVVIHRLPLGESVVTPRSRCPQCTTPIEAWNNLPVVSWLLLRGRCAHCRAPISVRYPAVELLTGVLWVAVAVRFGLTAAAGAGVVFVSSLVAITFIDIDHFEIPDEISLPGIVLGAIARPLVFDVPWYDGVLGAAIGGGILYAVRWSYEKVRGVEGMGLGDVKLIAMLAAFLGPTAVLPIILVSSIVGLIVGSIVLALAPRAAQDAPADTGAAPAVDSAGSTVAADNGPPSLAPSPEPPSGDDDDDDGWVPPPTAVPFGPFLALGGLSELLLGPLARLFSLVR